MTKYCVICKKKRSSFNKPGETVATHCGDCKEVGMINVKSKKCIICKNKIPYFNKPGEKIATHCGDCKEVGMVDVKSKKCPNCKDWPDARVISIKKYDGYCATCFKRLFPNDPRSKIVYKHTKEIRVRNFINSKYDGFIHDKPIYTTNCDCTHRRRIDHRKLIGNTLLAIETDEFGHKDYDEKDEEIRYDDLYMIHSGKWIFIRFNPDRKDIDYEDNQNLLEDEMDRQIERIENEENEDLLEIIKLY